MAKTKGAGLQVDTAVVMKIVGGRPREAHLLAIILRLWKTARIEKYGAEWLAFPRDEWIERTGMSVGQYSRSYAALKAAGLIEAKLFKRDAFVDDKANIGLIRPTQKTLQMLDGEVPFGIDASTSACNQLQGG